MHLSSARFVIAHGPKPALRSHRAQNAAASTASLPASVTIAIRPSVGWDGEGCRDVSTKQGNEIFLQMGLDRWNQRTEPFQQITHRAVDQNAGIEKRLPRKVSFGNLPKIVKSQRLVEYSAFDQDTHKPY